MRATLLRALPFLALVLGGCLNGPIYWTRPGADLSFLEHFWQKLLKRAGLRYRKFHSTRHTFITWAAEGCEALGIAPAPILAVCDWAGHSSVQETERYFHRVNRRTYARHVDGLDRYVRDDEASA